MKKINYLDHGKMSRNQKAMTGIGKIIVTCTIFITIFYSQGLFCLASADYALNASKWLTDQLFWIGIIALVISLVGCLLKKNYVGAIVTILGGGVILYIIKNPTIVETIGNTVGNLILGNA